MFLTYDEIVELTGRKRQDCQLDRLRYMGIEHKLRPDGSIAILTSHVNKVFGGIEAMPKTQKRVEPNWWAVR